MIKSPQADRAMQQEGEKRQGREKSESEQSKAIGVE